MLGAASRAMRRLGPAWAYSLGVYLATRVPVLLGALVVRYTHPHLRLAELTVRWDAGWYLHLARAGYLPTARMQWAFFPGFPLAIRGVHELTRLGYVAAAYLVAVGCGLLAVRAVYALGDHVGGRRTGEAAALLFAAWPGSVVFSMAYSEGLFLAATGFALLWLLRGRWVAAGLAGLVATATRPSGVALLAAAGVAALQAVWSRREWRALLAPLISALGLLGFFGYAWWRTGDPLAWHRAELVWHQQLDFGARLPQMFGYFLHAHGGGGSPQVLLEGAGLVMVAAMLVTLAWRRRQFPGALATYLLVAAFLVLADSAVGARPRMVLAIVPGFVVLARFWRPRPVVLTAVASASLLALVTVLYLNFPYVVP